MLRAVFTAVLLLSLSFSISLKEAERSALEYFFSLKISEIEIEKSKKDILKEKGKFLPEINFLFSYNFARKQSFTFNIPPLPPQEFTFIRGSYPSLTLDISQKIYDRSVFKRVELSREIYNIKKLSYKIEKNRLLFEVRRAYINSLILKSAIEVLEKQKERLRRHLYDVEEMYKNGFVAFKDIIETRVRIYEIDEKMEEVKKDYKKALNYLSFLTGKEVKEVEDIDTDSIMKAYERLKENINVEESPYILIGKENIKISEIKKELALSYFFPQIVFKGTYIKTEESDFLPEDRYFVSISLAMNIFSGFRRFREIEASELEVKRAVLSFEKTRREIELKVKNLVEDIESLRKTEKIAEKRLKDAEKNLELARLKYKHGYGTNREVLDAESFLAEAEGKLKTVRYKMALKIFELFEVLGYER